MFSVKHCRLWKISGSTHVPAEFKQEGFSQDYEFSLLTRIAAHGFPDSFFVAVCTFLRSPQTLGVYQFLFFWEQNFIVLTLCYHLTSLSCWLIVLGDFMTIVSHPWTSQLTDLFLKDWFASNILSSHFHFPFVPGASCLKTRNPHTKHLKWWSCETWDFYSAEWL